MIALGEIGTSKGANQIHSLQRGGVTRWSSHFASVNNLIDMFSSVCKILQGIIQDGSTNAIRGYAKGNYIHMRSFDFVFNLHLMHKTMGTTNLLHKALQDNSQDILNAVELISSTKKLVQGLRKDGWGAFVKEVVSFCVKHDIIISGLSGRYMMGTDRTCQQSDQITIEHHHHMGRFIKVIERQDMELKTRFTYEEMELLRLSSALNPCDSFKSFDIEEICTLSKKFYYHDFSDQDILILRSQLQHYELDVVFHAHFKDMSTLSELCHGLSATKKSSVYGLVDKLIRLILTLPVSTATTERAFLAMKLLKTELRKKIENEFLGDCMVMYIERQFAKKIDMEKIIDDLDGMEDRRVQFRYPL